MVDGGVWSDCVCVSMVVGIIGNVICKEVEEEGGNNGFQLSKFIERID